MKKLKFTILTALLIFNYSGFITAATIKGQDKKQSKAKTITQKELFDHISYLASDEMKGRMTGSIEYIKAAVYAAGEMKKAGLLPVIGQSKKGKSFFQNVPFSGSNKNAQSKMTVTTPVGSFNFEHEKDYKFAGIEDRKWVNQSLPVVFVGYGIEEPDAGWNDYEGVDLQGKAVVVLSGTPMKNGKPVLPENLQKIYSSSHGRDKVKKSLGKRNPAVILKLVSNTIEKYWQTVTSAAARNGIRYSGQEGPVKEQNKKITTVFVLKKMINELLQSQNLTLSKVQKQYKPFQLKDIKIKIELENTEVKTWNVIGMVKGTDPVLNKQYLVAGGHLDHLKSRNGQVYNGADDNASGCAGILEIAEAVAMNPPARSVIFVLFTAEEMGLYGSKHFVNNCPVPVKDIKAMFNLDMIGRTHQALEETRGLYVIDSGVKCEEFKDLIDRVNKKTVNWSLAFQDTRVRSDHANFLSKGIPSVMFFSGIHQDWHKPTDDVEKLEFDKIQKISQLVYELICEIGNKTKLPCLESN